MARKFTFFAAAGGPPLVLGDDEAGDKISVGLPGADAAFDEVQYVRGQFTERFGPATQNNITNTLEWSVDRDHGSEKAALNFVRDHGQALLGKGPGYLVDSGVPEIDTRYWLNAVIRPRCLRLDGQSTVFSYSMRAGLVTATAPQAPT